jgi:uncharacterized membrane protein YphA (DoxX/SURF4 family)
MPDWSYPLYEIAHLTGRVLFALVFVLSGASHLVNAEAMAGFAKSRGVPAPKAMTLLSGVMIIVGGVLVMLGWHRFIGAGLLVVFLLPTAFVMHAFWKETDPGARMNEMAHFLKDLALAGAALFMAYYAGGFWPLSFGH